SRIDMNPPYQRKGGIWSKKAKAYLIDTILNEYDIPKIYLADFTFAPSPLNNRNMHYAVIDGKQRLEAIIDFFEGRVLLAEDFVYEDELDLRLAGLGYRDLKLNYPEIADRFDSFNLSVMRVVADEAAKINEMFIRLNQNQPLTGSELRNAMKGVVPEIL